MEKKYCEFIIIGLIPIFDRFCGYSLTMNQEFKCSTNCEFSNWKLYVYFCKTTKSNIHGNADFHESTKIDTQKINESRLRYL